MIRLHFVGDGPRDGVTVPRIVEKILSCAVEESVAEWARLQAPGHGYEKKLRFAMLQAQARGAAGLVATVDRDNDPPRKKLKRLTASREEWRKDPKRPLFPTALGKAAPHLEAWLLDDPAAVRKGLQLDSEVEIPGAANRDEEPKAVLDRLLNIGERNSDQAKEALAEIARSLDPERCRHAKNTGFKAFQEDVRRELLPLIPSGA